MTDKELKLAIQKTIIDFSKTPVYNAAIRLFNTLGYNTERQDPFRDKSFECFKESYLGEHSLFSEEKAIVKDWISIDLLFQLTANEVSSQNSLFDTKKVDNTIIETYLFFSIELAKSEYNRTQLAQITREINKVFAMPALIVFKYGEYITLSVINRRLNKKDSQKDVLEKVTVIKDISTTTPHRAHIEILFDLSFTELKRVHKFTNFVELHDAWQKTLDTKELNKRFYRDLSNWYFWALQEVHFPTTNWAADKNDLLKEEEKVKEHNAKNLIRLLTRLLFIWFVKEKNLIPDELFDESYIKGNLLNGFEPGKKKGFDHKTLGSKYYRAILQNLFFATLNQTVGKREFRKEGAHTNVTNLMRYESYFKDPKSFIKLVEDVVPFMNGGLFECLDSPDPVLKGKKGGDVIIYEDGFSDRKDNALCVPDYIFFGTAEHADLSEELGDKKQKDVTVSGLINILKSYKFTITENTPIEEDIALDPELLGRMFENLLASYNPETKTTARKQTGSFYTPREIVNYMVDESLKAYLKQKLETEAGMKPEDAEIGLEFLVGYNEKEHLFDEKQTTVLINAIDNCKILDPACGSGAFPMGILHKLVHILHKLDPNNKLWKERQIKKALAIDDAAIREKLIEDIEAAFENNELDYGRKLYLIENCIYGVDIQPIATQISKLRFFISLIVDQKANKTKENFGIRPLPNLETKFVAANTLIGIEKPKIQISLFDNPEVQALETKIKDVRHRLFSAKTPATKRKLREDDQRIREEMGKILEDAGWSNESARQLAAWDPYNQNVSSGWFDPEWMFGIEDGFDVVIGNPPYIQIQNFSGLQQQKDWEKQKYTTYVKTGDVYCLFYERGYLLLRNDGVLTYITSNKWMRANYGKVMRKFFAEQTNPLKLIDFENFSVFEATVNTNIIMVAKGKNSQKLQSVSVKEDFKETTRIADYLSEKGVVLKNLGEDSWLISSNEEANVKKRIEKVGTALKDWNIAIYRGILTGLNDAFIVNGIKKDELISADPKSEEVIRPILLGRNIKRFRIEFEDLWLLFIPWHFPLHEDNSISGCSTKAEKAFQKEYPAIYAHLKQFKDALSNRNKEETGIRYEWYALQRCAASYYHEFEKEMITWGNLALSSQFAIAKANTFINAPSPLITPANKYLLAVLNSKLGDYYIRSLGVTRSGGYFEYKPMFVENLPVPKINEDRQKPFEVLVDCILFCKEKNMESESSVLESVIDGLVFDLYFPDEMKAAHCYITDRISSVIKPFKKSDTVAFKTEYIKSLERFINKDETISHSLVHRHLIKSVQIILGGNK